MPRKRKRDYPCDSYWEFSGDPGEDPGPIGYVAKSDLGDFNPYRLQHAMPLSTVERRQLGYVRLWAVRNGEMPDYFDSVSPGWPVLSERFVALLKDMQVEDKYELLPAPLHWEDTLEPIPGYSILHPLTAVECMDKERSKAEYDDRIDKWRSRADQGVMYLQRSKIPAAAKVFLLKENPGYTVFRGDIVAEYYKRGLTGAWFMHMPTEGEEYIDNEGAI